MADGDGPIRPRPPTPGQPIPRLWKAEPEPEVEKPARDRRSRRLREQEEKDAKAETPKSKPKAKKSPDRKPSKGKGTLVEETPELDTYEARQRARLLIGGLIVAVALIAAISVYNSIPKSTIDETGVVDEGTGAGTVPTVSPVAPSKLEQEAKNLLGTARDLAKKGHTKEATATLQRVIKAYPKTAAAAAAKQAMDRPGRNLPMFVDEEMVVATPVAKARPGRAEVVNAVDADPTVVSAGTPGDATLHLNPNPAEAPIAKAATASKPLPPGFRMEADSGLHASGWPYQVVSDRDGAVMMLVPAGIYTQGRDDGTPDESPSHKVKLSVFYVDQHEVTIRQYELYLKETGRRHVPARLATKDDPASPNRSDEAPATNITALEAKAYCEWAGKRLPTEAQWEAAARSTDGRPYPWGFSDPVWSRPRAPRQIDPVGSYPLDQSACGALDLAGNAWEWTQDWFDPRYYPQFKGQTAENPTGPLVSRSKPAQVVVKGGSKQWAVAWREGLKPETKLPYVGFRGVLPLEPTTTVVTPNPATPTGRTPPANRGGIVPF